MFKAEVLQDYTAVDDCPSLRAWVRDDKDEARRLGALDPGIIAYRNRCLTSLADITRVHVVQEPLTPYLQWEIDVCYKNSLIAYGAETVLLADAANLVDVQLPAGDFWMLDNSRVLQWQYEEGKGRIVGALLWEESRGDDLSGFRHLREALLDISVPIK